MKLPLIKKATPSSIAADLVGVQPMTGPTGEIFSMSITYDTRRKFVVSHIIDKYGDTIYTAVNTGNAWFSVKANRILDECDWCRNALGPPSVHQSQLSDDACWKYESDGMFKFMHEEDRTMFILRWDGTE